MQVAAMPTEDWEPVQQQEKGGASVDPTADAPEGAAASGGSGDDGKLDESRAMPMHHGDTPLMTCDYLRTLLSLCTSAFLPSKPQRV